MRKLLLAVALLGSFTLMGSLLSGCGCGSCCCPPPCIAVNECNACGCPTLVDTPEERNRRLALITDINFKEAVDDWDFIWLYDRPSYLTYWNPRLEP
jgi:hypothetical protein